MNPGKRKDKEFLEARKNYSDNFIAICFKDIKWKASLK